MHHFCSKWRGEHDGHNALLWGNWTAIIKGLKILKDSPFKKGFLPALNQGWFGKAAKRFDLLVQFRMEFVMQNNFRDVRWMALVEVKYSILDSQKVGIQYCLNDHP